MWQPTLVANADGFVFAKNQAQWQGVTAQKHAVLTSPCCVAHTTAKSLSSSLDILEATWLPGMTAAMVDRSGKLNLFVAG